MLQIEYAFQFFRSPSVGFLSANYSHKTSEPFSFLWFLDQVFHTEKTGKDDDAKEGYPP